MNILFLFPLISCTPSFNPGRFNEIVNEVKQVYFRTQSLFSAFQISKDRQKVAENFINGWEEGGNNADWMDDFMP